MSKLPTIIAGPCSMESESLMMEVAGEMTSICSELGFDYVFKSSFLKANRSSVNSYVGPGLELGVKWLQEVRSRWKVKTTTDVHETPQVRFLADAVDIIQIPALLSRQTDLIRAAAESGKTLNIKRGQFMAPWKLGLVVEKARAFGATEVIITERGSFNGYDDLIVDFRTLIEARKAGAKTAFDATHSVQRPALRKSDSGGAPEYIRPLTRAATAIGVDFLFFETHPDPSCALSDGACMLPLAEMRDVLREVKSLCLVVS